MHETVNFQLISENICKLMCIKSPALFSNPRPLNLKSVKMRSERHSRMDTSGHFRPTNSYLFYYHHLSLEPLENLHTGSSVPPRVEISDTVVCLIANRLQDYYSIYTPILEKVLDNHWYTVQYAKESKWKALNQVVQGDLGNLAPRIGKIP